METSLVLNATRTSHKIVTATGLLWKTTGRYIVHNIAQIIAKVPRGKDLYVNLRTYPSRGPICGYMARRQEDYSCSKRASPRWKRHQIE